jgi:hypothetical protein
MLWKLAASGGGRIRLIANRQIAYSRQILDTPKILSSNHNTI